MKRIALIILGLVLMCDCLPVGANGDSSESMTDRARAYIEKNMSEEAIRLLDIFISNGPPDKEIVYLKGEALRASGRYEEALSSYESALFMDRSYYEAQAGMCEALSALCRCDEVADCYDDLVRIRPSPEVCNLAGNALINISCPITYHKNDLYSQSEIYAKALEFYNKSVALDEGYIDAWNNRGVALGYLNKFDESIYCFDRAISLDSNLAEAWNNKGVSLDWLERQNQSMGCYDQAIELKPGLAVAWMNRARTLSLNMSLFPLAQENASQAIELDPSLENETSLWTWRYIQLF